MKKCPQCGHQNPNTSQFCQQCGAKLTVDADQPMTREAVREKQRKQKRKLLILGIAIILVLVLLLFGLTQITGKKQSKNISNNNSPKTEKTEVRSSIMKGSTSMADSASTSGKPSVQTLPNVDTKNLTTQQVNKWVYANIMTNWNKDNRKELALTADDQNAFIFSQSTDSQGCVEIQVQENHQSAFMKNIGADPDSTPTVGWYRINAQGYLQKGDGGPNNWQTIAQNYQEP